MTHKYTHVPFTDRERNFLFDDMIERMQLGNFWKRLTKINTPIEDAATRKHLSGNAPYHSLEHMKQVAVLAHWLLRSSTKQAWRVGVNEFPLVVAALCHDMHHSFGKERDDANVNRACSIFANVAQEFADVGDYRFVDSAAEIEQIIRATQYPYETKAHNLAQRCIRDADILFGLQYDSAEWIVDRLRRELEVAAGHKLSRGSILRQRVPFLQSLKMETEIGAQILAHQLPKKGGEDKDSPFKHLDNLAEYASMCAQQTVVARQARNVLPGSAVKKQAHAHNVLPARYVVSVADTSEGSVDIRFHDGSNVIVDKDATLLRVSPGYPVGTLAIKCRTVHQRFLELDDIVLHEGEHKCVCGMEDIEGSDLLSVVFTDGSRAQAEQYLTVQYPEFFHAEDHSLSFMKTEAEKLVPGQEILAKFLTEDVYQYPTLHVVRAVVVLGDIVKVAVLSGGDIEFPAGTLVSASREAKPLPGIQDGPTIDQKTERPIFAFALEAGQSFNYQGKSYYALSVDVDRLVRVEVQDADDILIPATSTIGLEHSPMYDLRNSALQATTAIMYANLHKTSACGSMKFTDVSDGLGSWVACDDATFHAMLDHTDPANLPDSNRYTLLERTIETSDAVLDGTSAIGEYMGKINGCPVFVFELGSRIFLHYDNVEREFYSLHD